MSLLEPGTLIAQPIESETLVELINLLTSMIAIREEMELFLLSNSPAFETANHF